ncbi:ribonuclease H-like domain-containing protein [Halospeciosus flavus]|uniref:Ribonuclease H-like domain-containing protein n=1 Tax=Halospeciosus flavus TaxID=3032283 RepID=A0ABD5Z4E6_9EURY|nr:ribonuclease H-like domain-containing protein [Halospeciosus flavus]
MRVENSFIPVDGVGETTERRLWADGITHWDEFHPDAVGPKTGDRIEEYIATAAEHLDDGNVQFFADTFPSNELWRLYENFADGACFFDIETTGLDEHRNDVTTVSFHRDGETRTYVQGRDLTAEALERELRGSTMLVSFNGKRFDAPFLEANFDLDVTTPHLDLMYTCKKLGLSGGLKAIEDDLGIGREGVEDVDGREAVRLWNRYENRGDEAALDRLVEYNRLDAENLRTLLETVHGRLRREVFTPHV